MLDLETADSHFPLKISELTTSPQSQLRKEMWLTGKKYDWLATWRRLEKAKWLTDDRGEAKGGGLGG